VISKGDILVVGGAGYIGSYMCKYLAKNGYIPVVLDNLVYGHQASVKWGPFYNGSAGDYGLLKKIFSLHNIEAVMHFAAFCYVGESVITPAKYYENNVSATLTLLHTMIDEKVENFIFSSSCAIYGEPIETPINEEHPKNPINPYGRTKLMVETILSDFQAAYDLRFAALRYFNAAGADPDGELGEDHNPETHLIPLVLRAALTNKRAVKIYGDDYPTKDGTCIRDYIHIDDLAQAHFLVLERLLNGEAGGQYNLGNGNGHSVKDVIDVASMVTGKPIPVVFTTRRAGDPSILIGSSGKAMSELGWQPRYHNLEDIIETAWFWHKSHPNGYV
jgi:UDP-glucose-4-epimerase GalE